MPTWPATLPQLMEKTGFQRTPKASVIEFGTEVGPGKRRRRSTARFKIMSMVFTMTTAQVADFEEFYEDDCEDGSLPFDYIDPIGGASASYRWRTDDPYSVTSLGAGNWSVAINVEKQP